MFEALQARFSKRIDADNGRARFFGVAQGCQHAGMIGAWVLPKNKNGVGFLEIFEGDRTLADTDDGSQPLPTGFMTHIGAIWQIVGAIFSHQ